MHQPTFAREIAPQPRTMFGRSPRPASRGRALKPQAAGAMGLSVSSTAACSPVAAKKASKKAVCEFLPPRSVSCCRGQQHTSCHGQFTLCVIRLSQCHAVVMPLVYVLAVAQSRNLPGNQAPGDGGATQLS